MNELLQKTEDGIRQKAGQAKQSGIDRVVDAGVKIMFSEGGSKLFKEMIDQPGDVGDNAAEATAKLLGIMIDQSKGTMPPEIGVPASTILLCRGLDFLEEAGRFKVSNDTVAEATKALGSYVLQLYGVTPEKYRELAAKQGQGGAAPTDPTATAPAPAAPRAGIVNTAAQGA